MQTWRRKWQHDSPGTTDAMADKLLQMVEGSLKSGCKHGALNALQHFLALETEPDSDSPDIALRISPVLHGANQILSMAKYCLAMALTKLETTTESHFRLEEDLRAKVCLIAFLTDNVSGQEGVDVG